MAELSEAAIDTALDEVADEFRGGSSRPKSGMVAAHGFDAADVGA